MVNRLRPLIVPRWKGEHKITMTMKTVVVDVNAPAHLALRDVEKPSPAPDQPPIRVAAISLNRGEVRGAQTARPGYRPGWDLAGIVEQAARNGSGPTCGEHRRRIC
jgi:NADPH:quinone reductase-like Zn-dependent oxidoreductase